MIDTTNSSPGKGNMQRLKACYPLQGMIFYDYENTRTPVTPKKVQAPL
jgi:hypothetical protein